MIIDRMASNLGLSPTFVMSLANGASHEYKEYKIPKRTGGSRLIHHPSRRLKAMQRWLLTDLIEKLPVHPAAKAYRRNGSILDNASAHVASRYLLRMDLANFFPSITQVDLGKYIADRPALFSDWTPEDIDCFCKLVCRDSVLTIGAPTSPALSNAICYEMDTRLAELCASNNVTYTRYADDLFFSASQRNVLGEIEKRVNRTISELKIPRSLKVNAGKTRHSSKRGTRRVTGIVLGSDGHTYIGRGLKRKIRALIHRFDRLDEKAQASLAGMIAYAVGFDPEFVNSLIVKYGLTAVRQAKGAPTVKA